MSATVVLDSKASDDTKVVIRPELKRNGEAKPSDEEIASCGPCRMIIVVAFCLGLVGMLVAAIVIIAISPRCVPVPVAVPISWWKKDMYYEVYVPSFQDTDSNGFGDLKGVEQRLSYLKEIGAKTVILSGVVSQKDFKAINNNVGKVDDLKSLVSVFKKNEIRIVLAFNPTYTSTDHKWFIASKSSKTAKERGYYLWGPNNANNWKNIDGNSAWVFDSATNEASYNYYGTSSPALNYSNPNARTGLKDALKYWMADLEVNGFKLDGVERMVVDSQLRDSTKDIDYAKDQPGTHEVLKELNTLATEHSAVLIGALDTTKTASYFGSSSSKELHVVLSTYFAKNKAPLQSSSVFNSTMISYIGDIPTFAWPGWTLGGTTNSRVQSRFTQKVASLMNVMLLTLPGTVVPFYGNELLLADSAGKSTSIMLWNDKKNSGFSNASSTWVPVSTDYKQKNLEKQKKANGTFTIFKTLSALRAKESALSGPQFDVVYASGNVMVYYRSYQDSDSYLVALNFGPKAVSGISLASEKIELEKGLIVLDTEYLLSGEKKLKVLSLGSGQGLVFKVLKKEETKSR